MAKCTATTLAGSPCKTNARNGSAWCRWHDPSDTARAVHRAESAAGGIARHVIPNTHTLASLPGVAALNLETPQGLRGLIAKLMHALTTLPTDTKLANAIGFLATSQRSIIEQSDIVSRIEALEAAQRTTP